MNMNVYMHLDHMLFTTFAGRLVLDIQLSLVLGSSLYIRYNTVANVVNSKIGNGFILYYGVFYLF